MSTASAGPCGTSSWWRHPVLQGLRVLCTVGLAFLAVIPPELVERWPTVCLFRRWYGVECWGCGMTRAMSWLLHGHVATALGYHRGVVVVLVLVSAGILSGFWRGHERILRATNPLTQ